MRPGILAALAMALGGCAERAPPDPPPAPVERVLAEPGEPPPPPSAWPERIIGLREALEAFTDVDACLDSLRARTPTAVAEGVADLGYDRFLEDVCGGLAAVREGSAEGCDALSVSTARDGCRRRLALFHGEPAACPEDPVRPGREPVCVAWASRDEDLCRAASVPERTRCRAVMRDDPRRCRRAGGGDRVRCEAAVTRYASAIGGERRASPAARGRLELRARVDDAEVILDLARGVRLVPRGCRTHLELGEARAGAAIGRASPSLRITLSLPARLELPARLPLGALDAVLTLDSAERGHLTSQTGARGEVVLSAYERRLGGAVEGTLEAELTHLTERVVVRGRFSTYVRDLDPLDDACLAR